MPDYITLRNNETEDKTHIPALQIWVDPAFDGSHKDPVLLDYIAMKGEEGYVALIRRSGDDAFVVFPPALTSDKNWHEEHMSVAEEAHSVEDIVKAVGLKLEIEVNPSQTKEIVNG